jgi:hypothetical protein
MMYHDLYSICMRYTICFILIIQLNDMFDYLIEFILDFNVYKNISAYKFSDVFWRERLEIIKRI